MADAELCCSLSCLDELLEAPPRVLIPLQQEQTSPCLFTSCHADDALLVSSLGDVPEAGSGCFCIDPGGTLNQTRPCHRFHRCKALKTEGADVTSQTKSYRPRLKHEEGGDRNITVGEHSDLVGTCAWLMQERRESRRVSGAERQRGRQANEEHSPHWCYNKWDPNCGWRRLCNHVWHQVMSSALSKHLELLDKSSRISDHWSDSDYAAWSNLNN